MNKKILISFLLVGLTLVVLGCAQAATLPGTGQGAPNASGNTPVVEGTTTSGTQIAKPPDQEELRTMKIGDMLSKPDAYWDKDVLLEGKLVNICKGNGCWFVLDDNTGTIYVDLAPSGLTVTANKLGATAKVYGTVTKKGGDTYLIGKKVEF